MQRWGKKCIKVKPQAGKAISKNISQEEGTKGTSKKLQTKICSWRGKVLKGPFKNARYREPATESSGLTYNQDRKELFQENKN